MTSADRLMAAGELPTTTSASYGRINNNFVLLVEFRTLEAHEAMTKESRVAVRMLERPRNNVASRHVQIMPPRFSSPKA